MKILTARHVVPVSSAPIEDGAVAFENDKLVAVGKKTDVIAKYPNAETEDFGEAAVLPGFVNAHAHLELTAMRGFLDRFDDDFTRWLLTLTKVRGEILTDDDVQSAATLGVVEGAHAGVTCFADIGRFAEHGFEALKRVGLRGVSFQETEFSPADETAAADFEKLIEKYLALRETETDLVKAGLSPHSPYTVGPKLFQLIAEYAVKNNVKVTIHAAESDEESELLECGTGFFAGMYEKFGNRWRTPQCTPLEYLERLGALVARPLLAHCVKVSERDIELIVNSDSRVAHCPKSNAKFGHGVAPLEKFLAAGIKTGFGSDSVASNNTCDILEEARFATLVSRTLPDRKRFLQPFEIIETATLGGARALGLEDEIGSLETGKQADLMIVSLENAAQMPVHDVYSALVFAANARDVRLTIVAGEEASRGGAACKVDETELKAKLNEIREKMRF
ncbi:MAG TPA: amidohydrolase family protein [Pyrinomonadaceae bacterium]|jgi:5-methylthioadenosine/S-adenosylhomocysteine deaminase